MLVALTTGCASWQPELSELLTVSLLRACVCSYRCLRRWQKIDLVGMSSLMDNNVIIAVCGALCYKRKGKKIEPFVWLYNASFQTRPPPHIGVKFTHPWSNVRFLWNKKKRDHLKRIALLMWLGEQIWKRKSRKPNDEETLEMYLVTSVHTLPPAHTKLFESAFSWRVYFCFLADCQASSARKKNICNLFRLIRGTIKGEEVCADSQISVSV